MAAAIAVLAAAISLGSLVMASRPMQERTLCRFTTPSIDRSDRASEIEHAADQLATAWNSGLSPLFGRDSAGRSSQIARYCQPRRRLLFCTGDSDRNCYGIPLLINRVSDKSRDHQPKSLIPLLPAERDTAVLFLSGSSFSSTSKLTDLLMLGASGRYNWNPTNLYCGQATRGSGIADENTWHFLRVEPLLKF